MKAVILAGGLGTRLTEETSIRPKPMVEVGGMPILWHIMKIYAHYGVKEFIVCCGYKGYLIKEFFANYFLHSSDVTFDLSKNEVEIHRKTAEPWKVTLIDTGTYSQTGGRLRRIAEYVSSEDAFCFTYGDGLTDLDIDDLTAFHLRHGKKATITAVRPPGRFGALSIRGDDVTGFTEKPHGDGGLINGGFFVLSPDCLELIDSDETVWEHGPLQALAAEGEIRAYHHDGFWQPMDTLREKNLLEEMWNRGDAPWKKWVG